MKMKHSGIIFIHHRVVLRKIPLFFTMNCKEQVLTNSLVCRFSTYSRTDIRERQATLCVSDHFFSIGLAHIKRFLRISV